jgi:hypothetical protein
MKNFIMACLVCSVGHAKIPNWASHNSTKLSGQILTTACHGTGPSIEIARGEALKSCQSNASHFFKSKIRIKSLSVETEKSVGFHQEVSNEDEIDGLICDPQNEQVDELDSQFSIWLSCKFDLKKASSNPIEPKVEASDNSHLNTLESSKFESPMDIQIRYVFISVVPKCESIIVKGSGSRTIQCKSNPLKVQIKDKDNEILVRAKGYKPKTINVKGVNANDTIQVLMDLL